MYRRPLQQQVNDAFTLGTSLLGLIVIFGLMKSVIPDPQELEETGLHYLPKASGKIMVLCPICKAVIEVPDGMTRTNALRTHVNLEHGPGWKDATVGFQPYLLVDGGERIPEKYSDIAGFLRDPLPEYSLLALLTAVEAETGEKKIDAVLKQLKSGVEAIQDSQQFRLFLTTMAKFHDYSIGNQILIMIQKPDATRVAGFNTWKDLGRWVNQGEKGIAILAPVMPPKTKVTCPGCGAEVPRKSRFCPECGHGLETPSELDMEQPRYFRVVHVFDISQTRGDPLTEYDVPTLTGEANENLFQKVLTLAGAQGLDVSFESRLYQDPATKGSFSGKSIWVRPEEPRAQQFKTLLHEVAHYYSEGVFRIPRQDAETIAESAAFVVGAHFGFDTGVRSFPYVALWARDKKVLENNLTAIRRVSTAILEALEK